MNIDATRISYEPGDQAERESRTGSQAGRAYGHNGTVPISGGEVAPVNPAGRWPANVALSHLPECERVGERRVKGSNSMGTREGFEYGHKSDGWGNIGKQAGHDHVDPDGLETVAAYNCAPGCAVAELDRQSGERPSAGRYLNPEVRNPRTTEEEREGWIYQGGLPIVGNRYANETGGASRFFATFHQGEDDVLPSLQLTPSDRRTAQGTEEHAQAEAMPEVRSPDSGGGHQPDRDDKPLCGSSVPEGQPARFRYVAKASRAERNAGLEGFEAGQRPLGISNWDGQTNGSGEQMGPSSPQRNSHPTVKPVELMRWLCRLVTPPDGTVLDPFCGSGTTGIAAVLEDFDFIGIEREAEYVEIAKARIDYWAKQPKQLDLLDAA